MAKTKNDEIYERGVRDGQTKGWLDRLVQANIPKISEKDDIYDKGYTFGLKHRPEEKKQTEESSSSRDEDSSDDDSDDSSGSDYSSEIDYLFALIDEIRNSSSVEDDASTETDSSPDYEPSYSDEPKKHSSTIPIKFNPPPRKSERENLVDKVLSMDSFEMEQTLVIRYGEDKASEDIRKEVILRKVMDKDNNIYGLIVFSQTDNEFRPYAQKRLEALIKEHPELRHISSNINSATINLLIRDDDGSRALKEARRIQRESDEIDRINKTNDAEELLEISKRMSGSGPNYAYERYCKVVEAQMRERRRPGYIVKSVLKGIFGIKSKSP
ncbi:MAG: hypothetical protein AABX12_00235 [Nanoarchaeota archaeon]